jgi:hypothetical protein
MSLRALLHSDLFWLDRNSFFTITGVRQNFCRINIIFVAAVTATTVIMIIYIKGYFPGTSLL